MYGRNYSCIRGNIKNPGEVSPGLFIHKKLNLNLYFLTFHLTSFFCSSKF